jgi:hypothetical protein
VCSKDAYIVEVAAEFELALLFAYTTFSNKLEI